MRTLRALVLPAVLLCLSSCGPIMGQLMKAGEGIDSFVVTEGRLGDLRTGSRLLVFGPFAKTADAFYICRGEDAANFSEALRDEGLFQTELHLERDYDRVPATAAALRTRAAQELRADLGLDAEPELLLLGTILHRSMIVAPARGVVTDVGYRLEFVDLATRKSVVVEVSAKMLFERTIREIVRDLALRRATPG